MAKSKFKEEHSCIGKIGYTNRSQARLAANALRQRGASERPTYYDCQFCSCWHVTSNIYHGVKPTKSIRRRVSADEMEEPLRFNRTAPYHLPPPEPAVTNLGQLLKETMMHQDKPIHTRCRASEHGNDCDLEAQTVKNNTPLCTEHAAKACQPETR